MKKVLVTGATGYIGAKLCNDLAEDGYRITAFSRKKLSNHTEWIRKMEDFIFGDIRDKSTIIRLTKKSYDIVIHLISLDHFNSDNDPSIISSVNVMPTWELLNVLTKKGLEKFLYFSTTQTYGVLPSINIFENQIQKPLNNYGLTHLLSENICNYFNRVTETECINIRLSNSYGSPLFYENNCWWLVINDLCKMVVEKNLIELKSDGSPQRDFIHLDDVSNAVKLLIESDQSNDNNFHIASGNTLTILELAYIVRNVYHKKYNKKVKILLPDNNNPQNLKFSQDDNRFVIDITKLKRLGFNQSVTIDEGINELFDYFETINK